MRGAPERLINVASLYRYKTVYSGSLSSSMNLPRKPQHRTNTKVPDHESGAARTLSLTLHDFSILRGFDEVSIVGRGLKA